jgi:hypothetical protein
MERREDAVGQEYGIWESMVKAKIGVDLSLRK